MIRPSAVATLTLGWAVLFHSTCGLGATPASGVLTDTSGPITYTAGPFPVANPTPIPLVDSSPQCSNPEQPCDDFSLTVSLPADFSSTHPDHLIKFTMAWDDAGVGQSDYDLWIYEGVVPTTNGSETPNGRAASSANPESTSIRTFNGSRTFTVKVVPYTPTNETVTVRIELVQGPVGSGGGGPFGDATPIAPDVPRYQILAPPAGSSANGSSGEFNIGFNPAHGNIMAMSSAKVYRVTPPERREPALPQAGPPLWIDASPMIASVRTLDPILVTDQETGRTYMSNQTTGANALFATTDDDGENWIEAAVSPPVGGVDHQSIGVGPYPSPLAGLNLIYPNAVYFCSQALAPDFCQRSDDGGLSFGPGVPINGLTSQCGGLHGHIKVGPDGAVYVPNKGCGEMQGGNVSMDAGVTWTEFLVPDSVSSDSDPSIGIDRANTLYFCHTSNGLPAVAVSHDNGATWSSSQSIGASVGIKNAVFPEAVAGDAGRAACGFLGTNVGGGYQGTDFPGKWYLFIATTYDGGATWTTVNATPNDPVQGAGGICTGGLGCGSNRNLLDFNEVTIDDQGRVLFGYDDGCVSDLCLASGGERNDFVAYQRIARQSGGNPLFTQFDVAEPTQPGAPYLEGIRYPGQAELEWHVPDNGGAAINAYRIRRGTGGTKVEIATVSGDKTQYIDASVDSSESYYYYDITAVNAEGDSQWSNEAVLDVVEPPSVQSPCEAPGLAMLDDASGDSLTGTPGTDLKQFQLAQPYAEDGSLVLRFQLDTDVGQNPQVPASYWYVSFKTPDGTVRGVRMVYPSDGSSPAMPLFESYVASASSGGIKDGRFVENGSEVPASPESFYDAANGTIVIVVPISDLGLAPGELITGFNAAVVQSVSTPVVSAGQTIDEMPDGLAYQGVYAIGDNAACAPNSVPFAVLAASPLQGSAPVDVHFDASASSDPDADDGITTYHFDFGDESDPVTQSAATITHTYQGEGRFPAVLSVTDSRGATSNNAAFQVIEVNECFEDADSHIAYSKGWHAVSDEDASAGQFHLTNGGSTRSASFAFHLDANEGNITYHFGTSKKGGHADVYIDDQLAGTVSFKGDAGNMHDPVFGSSATFGIPASDDGSHQLEINNISGAAYVDRFCISGASAASGSNFSLTSFVDDFVVPVGGQLTRVIHVNADAGDLSVLAESSSASAFKLMAIGPGGNIVGIANSKQGVASFDVPVSVSGDYILQTLNLGLAPAQIWNVNTSRNEE